MGTPAATIGISRIGINQAHAIRIATSKAAVSTAKYQLGIAAVRFVPAGCLARAFSHVRAIFLLEILSAVPSTQL